MYHLTFLQYPKIKGVQEVPKMYNSSDLKSEEEVYITHVFHPDKFYVRKVINNIL